LYTPWGVSAGEPSAEQTLRSVARRQTMQCMAGREGQGDVPDAGYGPTDRTSGDVGEEEVARLGDGGACGSAG